MFSSILVPIDLEEESSWKKALPLGISLSENFAARLTLATVVEDRDAALQAQWSAIGYRRMIATAEAKLALLSGEYGASGEVKVGAGTISTGILTLAREAEADLIVLASHRPGLRDRLIGAHAAHVAQRATCSVLVVRD